MTVDQIQNAQIAAAMSLVRGDADLRVWSVIVTIMGDMARAPGDTLSGASLNGLMGALGVRPDTTRVALHRLRKDDWITSTREGRSSLHALSDHGRAQTIRAAERIYGGAPAQPKTWHLAMSLLSENREHSENRLTAQGFSKIASGVYLGTTAPDTDPDLLCFSDKTPNLPAGLVAQLLPAELRDDIVRLTKALESLDRAQVQRWPALERTALRILILHSWRRIALRLPDLPIETLWPDFKLRHIVGQHIAGLGPAKSRHEAT